MAINKIIYFIQDKKNSIIKNFLTYILIFLLYEKK